MQLSEVLQFILLGICIFCIIFFFFGLGRIDWDTNVEEVLRLYRKEVERTKKELDEGNKKINDIENKIYKCKKKLNISLFDKNRY